MPVSHRLDALATIALVAAATIVASTYVYNSFFREARRTNDRVNVVVGKDDVEKLNQIGRLAFGSENSKNKMYIFEDFECPACSSFHNTVVRNVESRQKDLAVYYVPFPLDYHKNAIPTARAAECIADRHALVSWMDKLYSAQDELGKRSIGALAADAGIGDTTRISSCAYDSSLDVRINAGIELGRKIDIPGTPGIVLNGVLLALIPTEKQLDSILTTKSRD